ncbi:thioredoxin [Nannocystis exedens]|uniref:Thioredoxin n=1 Tax=Nannocystis exedens TaxID=54 RepID=A0A1I2BX48_9BACT|nr:thioredoxin domain-containing protein [Nannocystis exedens]PCC71206.1 thiol reductase thioredoxin [Nannocystis exedens]SFE60572.1 thioredoxin [Nannocystis exedens]
MPDSSVLVFTDADFQAEVLGAPLPVYVEFWATWSPASRAVAASTQKLAVTYAGKLKVGRLNVDENQDTPQTYGIRSIPTVLVFKGGKVVAQVVGANSYSAYQAAIAKLV